MVFDSGGCPGAAKIASGRHQKRMPKNTSKKDAKIMPKWSPKGDKMKPKWLPDASQNGVKKQTEESIANRAPREAPRFAKRPPGTPQERSRGTRAVRAAPINCFGRRMSFLTFSIKSDPGDIEKIWFSLSKTMIFHNRPFAARGSPEATFCPNTKPRWIQNVSQNL